MKKKILTMLVAVMCLATSSLNYAGVASAENVDSENLFTMGDVNGDGNFSVVDVIMFRKWLLAVPDVHLVNWKAADFCNDNRLNAADLSLMKRALMQERNSY